MTLAQIKEAKTWLETQRAVVHPGPIETIEEALNIAEAIVRKVALAAGDSCPRKSFIRF